MSSMFCYSHGGTRYLGACTGEPGLDGSAMELRSLRSVVVAEPPGRVPAEDALGDSQPRVIGAPGDVGDRDMVLLQAGIDNAIASTLIGQLVFVDFSRRHRIFTAGEPGERLYIVTFGTVKITRRTDTARTRSQT